VSPNPSSFCGSCRQPLSGLERFCPQCGQHMIAVPSAVTPRRKRPWLWLIGVIAVLAALGSLAVSRVRNSPVANNSHPRIDSQKLEAYKKALAEKQSRLEATPAGRKAKKVLDDAQAKTQAKAKSNKVLRYLTATALQKMFWDSGLEIECLDHQDGKLLVTGSSIDRMFVYQFMQTGGMVQRLNRASFTGIVFWNGKYMHSYTQSYDLTK